MIINLRAFNANGLQAFSKLISEQREKVQPKKAALVGEAFIEDARALALDENLTMAVPGGSDLDADMVFSDRCEMGRYLSEILPGEISKIQPTNIEMWSWISAVYLGQLLEKNKSNGYKLWSEYRYIPNPTSKLRYYRHLAFMATWLHRTMGDQVAKFFLSIPPYVHSDTIEQLYTQDRDFLSSKGAVEASLELHFDQTTQRLKPGALSENKPGSARRMATKIVKQLQMNYDLQSMDKRQVLDLLPSEFDSWRTPVSG